MDSIALLTALSISLGLTVLFEVGFFYISGFIEFFRVAGKRDKKDLLLVILVNTLTNPIVVLLYWIAYFNTNWNPVIILLPLEFFAILTEGFIYSRYALTIRRPFLFSFAANVFSFSMGFLLQYFVF